MTVAALLDRLDALEARLDAARRRSEAPGQLALDLLGGGTAPSAKKGPGGGEQCGGSWIDPNKTCHKGQGQAGPAEPPPMEARRSRPKERISFEQPIVGPTGAKLTGYTWQWTLEEVPDKEGELVEKRVSNWEESLQNVETGRNVVHQFEVQVGGEARVVSAESALKLLGFTDSDEKKRFGSLKSTARTVARLRMALHQLDEMEQSWQADWAAVESAERPEITSGEWEQRDGYRVRTWRMGDAKVDQIHNSLGVWSEQEVVSNLVSEWKGRRMEQRGWNWTGRAERTMRSKLNRERGDLQKRLQRAEKKLQAIPASERSDGLSSRLDAFQARLDALKRRCSTGYGCGSACISVKKECRSEGKASTSKERLQRLEQLARGEIKPRGLGVPKVAEARALVEEIQARRGQRAQELRAQRSERTGSLIPTDQPFAPELEARLRRGITKRSIRTGAVNYGGEELAEALLKVARAPGQQGVNARKAIAFMEEAGIMPNVAAVDAVEVKRVTDKQIGTPEIPWNDGRKLAKLVQQMGLVTDERMEWYRQDNTQAGRIFVRRAELVRNPSSLKPSPEEERAKIRLNQHIEDLEKESAAFDRGIQQGWRFEEDRKEALSYYTRAVKDARKTYNSLREGRLNELKWAAQEILTTNTKGLSNNDSGGFYLFGQKAYVARAGDGKGFAAGLKVDAAETDPLRMQSEYSSHLRQYLPERLEAMDKKGADYFLISEGPIAYKGRLSSAEQALSIHIHELGHVIDSFAGVRLRSIPGRYSSSGQNETVLMHELGSERIKSRPPEVMELLQQKRGPSAYALTNDLELFAESFASWVFAPKAFEREHPELYDWVESRVGLARQTMARHGKLAFNESW